ncbi:unnamed protein product [Cyclocybe aegerita]|uniref:MoaB/Mog domain-containing protein n=1 Tax=Cyclocybe aegerita TaxID=1973307 RepID=A0A8S0XKE6_CYCAE|nr:unnamed protein product [Cyclocybe aegerita]
MVSTRVAILTVSDTASTDATADKSGPTIRDIVSGHACVVQSSTIVPDDKDKIAEVVKGWCASGKVDWIITTGGTGFGVRDVTPEAVGPLIERPAPGLVHLMLATSLKHTAMAALSRPVAGTIGNTLITTLPGSVRAVKENLDALFQSGVVFHAIELVQGDSGKRVHTELQAAGLSSAPSHSSHQHTHHHLGHHHDHGNHAGHYAPNPRSEAALSHDPSAPVSARHRKSPFPQISLENALAIIKDKVERLPTETLPVGYKLGGYILAEDVYAPQDVPSTATTSVDGYALRSTDPPGIYNVLTSQTHPLNDPVPTGSIYRINTGGPLPKGTDTVIMVEDTQLVSTFKDGTGIEDEEKEVKTLVQVPPSDNVRAPGSDVRTGDLVMRTGDRVTRGGGEVGTLTFVGRKEVKVFKKPVVAMLSTGNEIVDLHNAGSSQTSGHDGWGGIYDTNRPSLRAVLESLGYEVLDLGIVPDDISAHLTAINRGLANADLLLTTGGTSMGPTDLLKPLIERYLNGTIHFGRVSVKPGKPTTFASVPVSEGGRTIHKPVFALPGNPASALVTFYVFVVPALRQMGGWPEKMCHLPKVVVQVQNPLPLDPRVEFHRVVIQSNISIGDAPAAPQILLKAYSTGGQRSSRAASLCEANGLVVLPPLIPSDGQPHNEKRKTRLEVGEFAEAILIGEIVTA